MGILGLTGYIQSQNEFFTKYELHGGYLVIDGHALAFELYRCCTERKPQQNCQANSAFGGDYDKYAHSIEHFVSQLQLCKVIPLVLIDGGTEIKKMDTLLKRMKEKLDAIAIYHPSSQEAKELLPYAAIHVFIATLKQRGVKVCRCVFEGDPCIAGVAKILDCPVLSHDSDYYIFGVKYISLDSLHPFVAKKINNRHVMRCKLFKIENLLQSWPGLTHDLLPIVAVIQGNDYIESSTFRNFCRYFEHENPGSCTKKGRIRIDSIFAWLQNRSLTDAINAILCTLPKSIRKNVLNRIEIVINGYLDLPYDMLGPLGFEEKYQDVMKRNPQHVKFEFQENIETLEVERFWPECKIPENFTFNEQFRKAEKLDNSRPMNYGSIKGFSSTWPPWFTHHYIDANFPSYFVQLMFHRQFLGMTQMEDLRQRSAEAAAFKIVSVIDDLLVAGRKESGTGLFYLSREGNHFVHRRLEIHHGVDLTSFPSLNALHDIPMSARKKIIDDTLGISDIENFMENIPEAWKLYVATVAFWMEQTNGLRRNSHYMYAVLFTMLIGVIDRKIGYYRSLDGLKSVKGSGKVDESTIENHSLIDALKFVTETDCLTAAPFFISNSEMDKKLQKNPKEFFDITVVHAFSQFQSCIRHAIALNALLGYPYENPRLGELFNGTMLYNLYIKFRKLSNVDNYIATTFQNSPSLLHLLNLLSEQVKRIIASTDKTLIFFFYGMNVTFGKMRGYASVSAPLEDNLLNLERTNKLEENEEDKNDDLFIDYDGNAEAQDEIRHLFTLKGRKIFDPNLACSNSGRGSTKRKNKKKKRTFDECLPAEEKALRKESNLIRRSSKLATRSERYDSSSLDEAS